MKKSHTPGTANKWNTRGPLVIFPIPSTWECIEAKALRVYYLTTEKVTSQHDWVKFGKCWRKATGCARPASRLAP